MTQSPSRRGKTQQMLRTGFLPLTAPSVRSNQMCYESLAYRRHSSFNCRRWRLTRKSLWECRSLLAGMWKQYGLNRSRHQLDSLRNRVLTKRTPLPRPIPAVDDSQPNDLLPEVRSGEKSRKRTRSAFAGSDRSAVPGTPPNWRRNPFIRGGRHERTACHS